MTGAVIPFRSTSVKAHSRSLPGRSPAYYRKHDELAREVQFISDRALESDLADEVERQLADPVFIATMGLPV